MQESLLDEIRQDISRLGESPWHEVPLDHIRLDKITGGLTNILFKATLANDSGSDAILVRIFGQSDGLLDRDAENDIYKDLSAAGVSPRLIGVYHWGRLEEYLTKNFPLKSGTDMVSITPGRDCVQLIGKALLKLHRTNISLEYSRCSADIFKVLDKWLSLAEKYADTIKPSEKCPQFSPPSIASLKAEVAIAKRQVNDFMFKDIYDYDIGSCNMLLFDVLCHNDLLSGNIMLDPTTNSIRLIDFEYSGINHAVADIANVFTAVCESIMLSGKPQDVANNFPSEQIQLHFVESYFGHEVPVGEEEAVLALIAGFSMLDELRWTIWGIIQANQSTVDFDYVFYYNSRFDAYKEYKRMFHARREAFLDR